METHPFKWYFYIIRMLHLLESCLIVVLFNRTCFDWMSSGLIQVWTRKLVKLWRFGICAWTLRGRNGCSSEATDYSPVNKNIGVKVCPTLIIIITHSKCATPTKTDWSQVLRHVYMLFCILRKGMCDIIHKSFSLSCKTKGMKASLKATHILYLTRICTCSKQDAPNLMLPQITRFWLPQVKDVCDEVVKSKNGSTSKLFW